jgi:hypothetical protein
MDDKEFVKREVDLLLSRDKASKAQSSIEATWQEFYEGGAQGDADDVARMADLEAFGVKTGPLPNMSQAGVWVCGCAYRVVGGWVSGRRRITLECVGVWVDGWLK